MRRAKWGASWVRRRASGLERPEAEGLEMGAEGREPGAVTSEPPTSPERRRLAFGDAFVEKLRPAERSEAGRMSFGLT